MIIAADYSSAGGVVGILRGLSITYNQSMSKKVEKQFPGQHEGEEVELLFRQHPLVMRKALGSRVVAILVACCRWTSRRFTVRTSLVRSF
jgi:hypothetical protein